ncbi:MAG: PD-(D/E)XK nuclease family protein [Actinobacteria bacterium]|nr:PD-(D/E)XK nuclease family protein [Actinomycetota bacterium]
MRYYSNSEFQTFKDCKRKWYLGWYRHLQLRKTARVGAAPLGTLVHSALAPWYVPEGEERQDPRETLGELIRHARAAVIEAYADDPQSADGALRELDKQHDLARAMIEGYVEWLEETGADSQFEVIGSEQLVQHEVTPGRSIIGRLDTRVRRLSDGVRLFIDHKTCQSFVDLQRSLHSSEQMPTYLILERVTGAAVGEYVEGAIFNGLRKVKRTGNAKPPFYDRLDKTYNSHELESMWFKIQGNMRSIDEVAARLDSGEDHRFAAPPHPGRDCHWKCEFYPVCPMFDDGSRAEDMLATIYEVGDSLARYPELSGGRSNDDTDS